jgi:hypothetical protein
MSIKTRALALGAAVALLAASAAGAQPGPHAVAAKKRSSAVRQVTKLLTGVYLTTYTSGSVTGASAQSTVHLCGGGRFLLISSSNVSTVIDDPSSYDHPSVGGETRTTGNWKVLRAQIGRGGRSASALVGYRTDDGDSGSVTVAASSRGVTVGGQPAEAGRSQVCG